MIRYVKHIKALFNGVRYTSQGYPNLVGHATFTIAPGMATYVKLTKKVDKRVEPPYGYCKEYSDGENKRLNALLILAA